VLRGYAIKLRKTKLKSINAVAVSFSMLRCLTICYFSVCSPSTELKIKLICLHFNGLFSMWIWLVCILDLIGAKYDGSGGDNWSCKTCKAPVKSSPPSSQHPTFYRPDALTVAQPTVITVVLFENKSNRKTRKLYQLSAVFSSSYRFIVDY